MQLPTLQPHLFEVDTALLTRRCVVRQLRESDGQSLYGMLKDNQGWIYDFYPELLPLTRDQGGMAEVYVRQAVSDWLLQRNYTFAIWDNETADLVGLVRLEELDWRVPVARLRHVASPGADDLLQEVFARVVRFGFLQLKLEKMYTILLADHYKVQRLMRKLGFSREGDLRGEFRKGSGALVDAQRVGLSREVFGE